ncbi:hypothetical protein EXU30_04055 [Shewanella maritima]|uniref:Uncharacterized protein n=1 Tax=Shewanella maritima TaxID=2520507 RepID=A0A411PEP0_9GAMM|nr:hypothetical protein [Shewanella maritima]QBF81964.1 hypothetical protein EXU30_04055 [Shewanella maritima]
MEQPLQCKVISISSATGWKVRYNECLDLEPLACWALVEYENGSQKIEGMISNIDGEVERAESNEHFLEYVEPL